MNREERRRSWLAGLLLATVTALILAGPARADTETDTGWRLRFHAATINFDSDSGGAGQSSGYDVDAGAGLGVNAEYRFSRRLGVDLGVLAGVGMDFAVHTAQIDGGTFLVHDTLSFTPLTAGLDVHLTPDNRVDLYFCPLLAWIRYGALVFHTGSAGVTAIGVDIDDDFAVGAGLGLGVPFGTQHRWSFNANLTYLDSQLNGSGSGGYRLDENTNATIVGLGFGYRL